MKSIYERLGDKTLVAHFLCKEGDCVKNDANSTFEKSDFTIRDDVEFEMEYGGVKVALDENFDAKKKFGFEETESKCWINLYAIYNPCVDTLTLFYTTQTENGFEEKDYIPTPEEKKVIAELIEEACMEQTRCNCSYHILDVYIEYYADKIKPVCELYEKGCRIRNEDDDFIFYKEGIEECKQNLLRYVGHDIKIVTYGAGETISIESETANEVIFSTDNPNIEIGETFVGDTELERYKYLLGRAVAYITQLESGEELYDTLHNYWEMTDEEILEQGCDYLCKYFEEQQGGMNMQ